MLVIKSPYELDIKDNVKWLLTPRPILDLRLFNEQNQMHNWVAKDLLRLTDVYIAESLHVFPEIKVADIILCGSGATYFYNEFSDINIDIVLDKQNCAFLANYNQQNKDLFLHKVSLPPILQKRYYNHNGSRRVRFSYVENSNYSAGMYSLKQQKWLIESQKTITQGLDEQELITKAQAIIDELHHKGYVQYEKINGKFKVEDLEEMRSFCRQIKLNSHNSIQDYIVYRLVRYSSNLFKSICFSGRETGKSFSF